MILNELHIKYMESLSRGSRAVAPPRGLINAGFVEYLWELPAGDVVTDEVYERLRVASPRRFIGGRWAGTTLTAKGREVVKRRRKRATLAPRRDAS